MAELVMILGESGSGKSASLRGFAPGEVCVLNVAGKRLPFRNAWGNNVINNAGYDLIKRAVSSGKYRRYVVDDSQYLLAFEAFNRAQETGYTKFTEMAKHFYDLLMYIKTARVMQRNPDGTYTRTDRTTDDVIVYFLHHVERGEDGLLKPKTQGKMLDEKLNIAGLFTTILLARTDGKDHWFETQNDGTSVAKSPMEMFEDQKIPNDLRLVDTVYRVYYGMDEAEGEEKP